jgi:putative ABC transport system permease protein
MSSVRLREGVSVLALVSDLRPALRSLLRSPGFAVFVILTLALGIGANTAVFTVADAFIFKPMPFPDAGRLVMLHQRAPGNSTLPTSVTPADFLDFQRLSTSFEGMAAYELVDFNLSEQNGPEPIYSGLVTTNFFDTLGMKPALGRTFAPEEDQAGKNQVVVLSYGLWQRHFGADPDIAGREIRLSGKTYSVVGVMSKAFRFPIGIELWTPRVAYPQDPTNRENHVLKVVARLKTGVPEARARAELESISASLASTYPRTNQSWGAMLQPLHRFITGDFNRQYSLLLLGAVFFVLLIACANVMNLQMARLSARHKEFAVRAALGAGRWRIVRQIVVESTILSLAGALASLLFSTWSLDLIVSNVPPEVARYIAGWDNIRLDGRAFAFTLAIAVLAGWFSGFIPALRTAATSSDANQGLKESGRGSSPSRGGQRLRTALVIAELAAALVVLIGAGLMVKGSRSLLDVNRNLRPQSILTMQIAVSDRHYSQPYQRAAFFDRVLARLAELPGVEGATLVSNVPYGDNERMEACEIEGRPVASASERRTAQVQVISPNYLETARIPLVQGRGFRESDGPTSLPVAIVSEKFAARYWPGQDPLNRRIRIGDSVAWLTVIGVAKDTRYTPWTVEIAPAIYQTYRQQPLYYTYIALRTRTDPSALSIPARSTIAGLDIDVPLWEIKPLHRVIANRLVGLSYVAVMLSVLGAIATILSAAGIYGLMAYSVSERTHEIGIRLALGAGRVDLLGMLARRGLLLTACGLGIGLAIAIPLARLLSNLIYGVSATDATTFGGSTSLLAAVALMACYLPARKAMSVDPIIALRRE